MNFRIVVILILIFFITFILYSIFYKSNKDVILIKPEYLIYKKKPEDPGGAVIPNTENYVYDYLKKDNHNDNLNKQNHYIIPSPENPLEIIYAQNLMDIDYDQDLDSIDSILAHIESKNEELSDIKTDYGINDDIMPNDLKVKQNNVLEDKTDDSIPGKIKEIDGIQIIETPLELSNITSLKVAPQATGGYKLQLSIAQSEKEAKQIWEYIKVKHNKILQDASMVIRKIEGKNDRIFYLVMAGTYPSFEQAKLTCKKLSSKKQNCIIMK